MFKDFLIEVVKKEIFNGTDSKQNDVPAGIMTKCPNCKK